MEYVNYNVGRSGMPDFQDGDIINGGNFSQLSQIEITANLTILNSPNMTNCNLTGEITSDKPFPNRQYSPCYWYNIWYDAEGNVVNPLGLEEEIPVCPHCQTSLIETIETEEGDIQDFSADGCRIDRPIGWTDGD